MNKKTKDCVEKRGNRHFSVNIGDEVYFRALVEDIIGNDESAEADIALTYAHKGNANMHHRLTIPLRNIEAKASPPRHRFQAGDIAITAWGDVCFVTRTEKQLFTTVQIFDGRKQVMFVDNLQLLISAEEIKCRKGGQA